MSQFCDLSIRIKILAIVAGGIIGLAVTLAFNFNNTSHNKALLEKVRNIYFPTLENLDKSLVQMEKIKETFTAAVVEGDEDTLDSIKTHQENIITNLNMVSSLDNKQKDFVVQFLMNFSRYIISADKLSRSLIDESVDMGTVQNQMKVMNNQREVVEQVLKKFRSKSYLLFVNSIDRANESSSEALVLGVIIGVITTIFIAFGGMFIGNSITNNINNVTSSLREIASGNGDLTQRLISRSNDEIGALVKEFNTFISKLQGVISQVTESTSDVNEAAIKIKQASQSSIKDMNTQRSEIQQVVNSISEMTISVDEVAISANQASNAARAASSEAATGRQVVEENMQAINRLAEGVENASEVILELNKHSDAIGEVLNVIRGIAEQTNLLALNAAIEAARAGEQGRGFAVVADEVRVLATRTHESTQEINNMINRLQSGTRSAVETMSQSREQAHSTVKSASRVGESLEKITEGVDEISGMNIQIASAAEEQSAAVREINNNIVNLEQVVNQVSDSGNIAEKDSKKLEESATQLKTQISVFHV